MRRPPSSHPLVPRSRAAAAGAPRPHPFRALRSSRQRGSVILFVLGLILLTSLLLTRFIERANTELLAEARYAQLPALRDEAYSALQVSLAVLADVSAVDNGLHSPAQGWGDPLAYANYTPPPGCTAEVAIEDETGKLSLPAADATTLQNLLITAGCLPLDAERVADAILAWTRTDHVAQYSESDDDSYQAFDPAITPPHANLHSFAELQLMPAVREVLGNEDGSWNVIGARFLDSVSLYNFSRVNLNTAGNDVLESLKLDPTAIDAQRRDGPDDGTGRNRRVLYATTDLGSALGSEADAINRTGVDATCLRVVVTVHQGGRKFVLTAVVQPGGSAAGTAPEPDPNATASSPRSWSSKSIDSAFRVLEIRENNGF